MHGSHHGGVRQRWTVAAAAAGLLISLAPMARAAVDPHATISVTCPSSPCATSLIATAIAGATAGDTIQVVAGTYLGTLSISKSIAIEAATPGAVTLDGQKAAGQEITIGAGLEVVLDGLTITGGTANSGPGAGIFNNGSTVIVAESTISANGEDSAFAGGGIANDGSMLVTGSTITANQAGGGSGIFNDGSLELTNSTIFGNLAPGWSGGGIANPGTLIARNATINGNSAYAGGGIWSSGTATLINTIVAGNTATSKPDLGATSATGPRAT